MERVPVESSSLVSVGYDDATHTLEVEFSYGGVYRYFVVPASVYAELMASDSIGRHFVEHIRNNYPFVKA